MQSLQRFIFERCPEILNRFLQSKWSRLLKVIGIISSVIIFAAAFASSASQIDTHNLHIHLGFLLATIVTISVTMCVGIFAWVLIACATNQDVSPRTALAAYLLSAPAKYLPGSVWNHIGKIALVSKQSLRSSFSGTLAVILELSTTLSSGIGVASLVSIIFNIAIQGISSSGIKLLLAIISLSVCFITPVLLTSWLQKGQHSNLTPKPRPLLRVLFFVAALQSANWILFSLAFWFSSNIIGTLSISYLPECIVAFSTSIVLGLLAFFAPNGIGIREITLMGALNSAQQPYVTFFSSTVIRVIFILIEMIGFLGALYFRKRSSQVE